MIRLRRINQNISQTRGNNYISKRIVVVIEHVTTLPAAVACRHSHCAVCNALSIDLLAHRQILGVEAVISPQAL